MSILARLHGIGLRKHSVCVEIGNDWLKVAKFVKLQDSFFVEKVALYKMSEVKEALSEKVKELVKEFHLQSFPTVTYLPRHLVTVRFLRFPSTDSEEIRNMVEVQVGKQTPFSRGEVIYGYKVMEEKDGYSRVMLIIVRRILADTRLRVLLNAGLKIEKLTISSEGVGCWFKNTYQKELDVLHNTFIVVDLDSNYSDFIVLKQGELVFTRSILIGTNQLVDSFGQWKNKFLEELQYSLNLLHGEIEEIKIQKMFLTGAVSHIGLLSDEINNRFHIPAEVRDPLKNVNFLGGKDPALENRFKYASFSGLIGGVSLPTEEGFDLTPIEIRLERRFESERRKLTIMGGLILLMVTFISALIMSNLYNKKVYLTKLREKIQQTEKKARVIEDMRMKVNLIRKRLNARRTVLNILAELYKLTPRNIYYTNVDIEEGKEMTLRGRANAMSDIFKFVSLLEKTDLFKSVKTVYTTTKRIRNKEYTEFELRCIYEPYSYVRGKE